jgi:hypothetical protein
VKSVLRIRLVKTENPGARATVNWNVCRIAIALYCLQSRAVNVYAAINPIIQSKTPSYKSPLHVAILYRTVRVINDVRRKR